MSQISHSPCNVYVYWLAVCTKIIQSQRVHLTAASSAQENPVVFATALGSMPGFYGMTVWPTIIISQGATSIPFVTTEQLSLYLDLSQ